MDRNILESLVRAHQAELYRFVRYLGADRSVAEDTVQETFLAAFRGELPTAPDDARSTAAWLRGIARNIFLKHCRRVKNSPVTTHDAFLQKAEGFWSSEFLRAGDGFDYVEALRACLEELSEKQRRLVDMRYAEKKSRSEMARLSQMTENGIKSLLQRIRSVLGECVKRTLKLEGG